MSKRAAAIEAEIDRRIAAAIAPDSPNDLTAEEFRELAFDYLWQAEDYNRAYPQYADLPHWDLWMIDAQPENALFVVLIFRHDGIEFFCGTGEAYQIDAYRDGIQNADQAFDIMSDHLNVPQPALRIERSAAEEWLGRGWKP